MKPNQLKLGVLLSYITIFAGTAISLLYTPIMLGLLGQSQYGLYQLVASVVSYLSLLTFGFSSAYVRFYSRYKVQSDIEGIARLNGLFLTVFSGIALLALVCGSILTANIHNLFAAKLLPEEIETAKILMAILVFNIALSFPFSVFNSFITANEKYFFQRMLDLIKTLSSPFITLPVLLMGHGSVGLVLATTALNIGIEIIYTIYCFRVLRIQINFRNFDFTLLKEIAVFSSFIFINIVVDKINWNVDNFLLGMYQGTAAVAVYSIASQLNNYYLTFSLAISSVFVPRINQLAFKEDADKNLNELFVKVGRIQFIVLSLILSGIIFFGQDFILLWIGKDYATSYIILIILIIPVTIPLIQTLGIEIQRAKNLHKFRAWLYLGIAIINVIISIPLTKAYAGVGSAMGTAIALFIGNGIIMNIYSHKKCGINIIQFWKAIFTFIPALILPLGCGALYMHYISTPSWMFFLLGVALYTLIFFASMWICGFNEYEKELLTKALHKFKRKPSSSPNP